MKRILAVLSLVLLLTACNDASRDPVIKGYRMQQIGGLAFGLNGVSADMLLDIDIENPSSAKYLMESLDAILYPIGDTLRIARVTLKEPVGIAPRSDETVSLPLGVNLLKPLALLTGNLELSDYEADVDLTIRKGALKKRIQQERLPLDRLEKLIGTTSQQQNDHENK